MRAAGSACRDRDLDRGQPGRAVGLRWRGRRRLGRATAVGGARHELGWPGEVKAALPADPGIAPLGGLEEAGGLPGLAAVGAELDLGDAARPGIRNAGDALI